MGHKFPKIHGQPWLETRLGRAITRRREFLRYSKQHHNRLAQGVEQLEREQVQLGKIEQISLHDEKPVQLESLAASTNPLKSTIGSTKATTLDAAQLRMPEEVTVQGDVSESSYATTEITAENEGALQIPPIPESGKKGKQFVCPYCWTTQCFKGKSKKARQNWK